MAKRLILPVIFLIVLVGVIVYVGGTPWVELQLLENKPTEIIENSVALSLQAAILILTAIVIGIVLLWSLILWLWRLPTRVKTGFGRRREDAGIDALEQALIAGAAGDGDTAKRKAKKAHDQLARPRLTGLVSARSLELAGNTDEARTQYKALLKNEDTAIAGYRGLTRMAEQDGDFATVTTLAKAACDTNSAPAWALQSLFRASVSQSDWDGALSALRKIEKHKGFDPEGIKRRRATLLSAKAAQQEKAGDIETAADTALEAAQTSSDFSPACALAARLLNMTGHTKRASSIIEKSWKSKPHPALALAYLDLYIGESQNVISRKVKALTKANPHHRESAILLAEHKLSSGDGAGALQALGSVLRDEDPSVRVAVLAAAIEDRLGNSIDAGTWRARAETAPLEANWSDLDPDGPAFDYTEADWQNLIISYGETGVLVHPRFGGQRRRVIDTPTSISIESSTEPAKSIKTKPSKRTKLTARTSIKRPSPDDPGIIKDTKPDDDLSKRLDTLLGDPDTS